MYCVAMIIMTETTELYEVDKIEEVPWNMNAMQPEEYERLKQDMKKNGVDSIDPILVVRKKPFLNDPSVSDEARLVLNGNHRLRAAKEIGWKKIRVVFDNELTDPSTARLVAFRKNAERGSVDEFKVAENFKWLIDHGWKQDRIASAYGIARETVGKRLSLLNVDQDVKQEMMEIPGVSASHFEPIASLEPELQKKALKEIKDERKYEPKDAQMTVRDVESIGKKVRQEEKVRKSFEEEMKGAKFPTCPTCSASPSKASYQGLPYVHDNQGHEWSIKTGKKFGYTPQVRKEEKEEEKKGPVVPDHVDLVIPFQKAKKTLGQFVMSKVKRFKDIQDLGISGRTSYASSELSLYEISGGAVEMSFKEGKKAIDLSIRPADYKDKEHQGVKTVVTLLNVAPGSPYEFKKLQEAAAEVLHVRVPKKRTEWSQKSETDRILKGKSKKEWRERRRKK